MHLKKNFCSPVIQHNLFLTLLLRPREITNCNFLPLSHRNFRRNFSGTVRGGNSRVSIHQHENGADFLLRGGDDDELSFRVKSWKPRHMELLYCCYGNTGMTATRTFLSWVTFPQHLHLSNTHPILSWSIAIFERNFRMWFRDVFPWIQISVLCKELRLHIRLHVCPTLRSKFSCVTDFPWTLVHALTSYKNARMRME